jgi:tetratricopeptide (TPR) repeat protein
MYRSYRADACECEPEPILPAAGHSPYNEEMSSSPSPPQPPSRTRRGAAQKPPRWFPWTSILLVSSLFLGVLAVFEAPREIGRWHVAAAQEHWDEAEYAALKGEATRKDENRQLAFARLEEALSWSPDEPNWIYKRAQWRAAIGKEEAALNDCNTLIGKVGETPLLLLLRIGIYQQLGRHEAAVKDAERLDALSLTSGSPSRGESLNSLAYLKAVGKIDLSQALKQADAAVRDAAAEIERNKKDDEAPVNFLVQLWRAFFPPDRKPRDDAAKLQMAMRLDTRGFVAWQLGNYEQALVDLQPAAETIEVLLREKEYDIRKHRKNLPDPREAESEFARNKTNAAVILYHRSLAHEKLGHSAAAAADRKRVFELIGREGDEKLF